MKQFRRLLSRGILVPFALVALVIASSVPASAATPSSTAASTSTVTYRVGPLSINW